MGRLLRLGIVAAWLVLFGLHIGRQVLTWAGVSGRFDGGAVVKAHLNRGYDYDLLIDEQVVGTARQTIETRDVLFVIGTRLDLNEVEKLPMMGMVISRLDLPEKVPLRLLTELLLDDRARLAGLEGALFWGWIQGTATATVDHRGLKGTVKLTGTGEEREIWLADVRELAHSAALAPLALPPGLRPGETFNVQHLRPLPQPPYLTAGSTSFTVTGREETTLRTGPRTLLRLTGGDAVFWVDDGGVVHKVDLAAIGLHLELTGIEDLTAPTTRAAEAP